MSIYWYEEANKIILLIDPFLNIFSIYSAFERFAKILWKLIHIFYDFEDILKEFYILITFFSILSNIYYKLYKLFTNKEKIEEGKSFKLNISLNISIDEINAGVRKLPSYPKYRQFTKNNLPLHKYTMENIHKGKSIFNNISYNENSKNYEVTINNLTINNLNNSLNKIENEIFNNRKLLSYYPWINQFNKDDEKEREYYDLFEKTIYWNSLLEDIKEYFKVDSITYGILSEIRYGGAYPKSHKSEYFEGIMLFNMEVEKLENLKATIYKKIIEKLKMGKEIKMYYMLGINKFNRPRLYFFGCKLKTTKILNIPLPTILVYVGIMPERIGKRIKNIIKELKKELKDNIEYEDKDMHEDIMSIRK